MRTEPDAHAQVRALMDAAHERGAEALRALDVAALCSFARCFVLCTGRSDRNVRAIADAVRDAAKRCGLPLLGIEGYEEGRWVLLDLGDAVVHVFVAETRAHYDLDRLWGDAPEIPHPRAAHAGATREHA